MCYVAFKATPGERLQTLRRNNFWEQSYVAEQLGVKQSTISAYERGITPIPLQRRRTLCMLFGVRLTYLD